MTLNDYAARLYEFTNVKRAASLIIKALRDRLNGSAISMFVTQRDTGSVNVLLFSVLDTEFMIRIESSLVDGNLNKTASAVAYLLQDSGNKKVYAKEFDINFINSNKNSPAIWSEGYLEAFFEGATSLLQQSPLIVI